MTAESDAPDTLCVEFGSAVFGERSLGTVRLRWQFAQHGLRWLAPADPDAVPLAQWPVLADGSLQPTLALPVGNVLASGGKRREWAGMSAADRLLLLALLDALPGPAEHVPDSALPRGLTRDALAASAAELHKDARRTLDTLRARDVARRLLHRGRRGT